MAKIVEKRMGKSIIIKIPKLQIQGAVSLLDLARSLVTQDHEGSSNYGVSHFCRKGWERPVQNQ
jgi:hypothetical protein